MHGMRNCLIPAEFRGGTRNAELLKILNEKIHDKILY